MARREPRAAARPVSDAALVVAVARYRQDALAEAYRRHAGAVYGLARRLLRATRRSPRRSRRRSSFVSGTTRTASSRAADRCVRYLLAQTHGRVGRPAASEGARRRREEREARATAEGGYDLEHEVWDLATAERVRSRGLIAARR